MTTVDLGCGPKKREGAIGLDNAALPGVDIVHDLLQFPYPFDSATVDHAILSHVIEHFTAEQAQALLNEIYRILRPGGTLEIHVPHAFSIAAWSDPTHRRFFTFNSIQFYVRGFAKSYYLETGSVWDLDRTVAAATLFDWKKYRLRKLDGWLSRRFAGVLNWFLRKPDYPASADLLVKVSPVFFVDIGWFLKKPE